MVYSLALPWAEDGLTVQASLEMLHFAPVTRYVLCHIELGRPGPFSQALPLLCHLLTHAHTPQAGLPGLG